MEKLKTVLLLVGDAVVTVISLPIILLWLISSAWVYGLLKLENYVVDEIWEDELTYAWNKFVNLVADCMTNLRDMFLMEMEL